MHKCEYCNACFQARPQVKHPRACQNCQLKRQRENEKSWHFKHKSNFDREYHGIQKIQRFERLQEISKIICQWIKTGAIFSGNNFLNSDWENSFMSFLVKLGIRKVNKFWQFEMTRKITSLS